MEQAKTITITFYEGRVDIVKSNVTDVEALGIYEAAKADLLNKIIEKGKEIKDAPIPNNPQQNP